MSQPQPKPNFEVRTRAPEVASPRDNAPKPLAVTGVMTRRPSPVHGLQSDVARAFGIEAVSDAERKIPFAITIAGASAFSLACWTLLYLAIRAI